MQTTEKSQLYGMSFSYTKIYHYMAYLAIANSIEDYFSPAKVSAILRAWSFIRL
jgi:hypothetical protein